MNSLKVKTKIFLNLIITLVFMLILSLVGYISLSKANKDITTMYNNKLLAIEIGSDLRTQTRANSANLYNLILNKDTAMSDKINSDIEKRKSTISDDMKNLDALSKEAKQMELYNIVNENLVKWQDVLNSTNNMVKADKQKEAYDFFIKNNDTLEKYQESVRNLNDYNIKTADSINIQNVKDYKLTISIFIFLIVISIVISTISNLVLSKNISDPLNILAHSLDVISTGDFSLKISCKLKRRKDELGSISNSMDVMINDLKQMINTVKVEAFSIEESIEETNRNIIDLDNNIQKVSETTQKLSSNMEGTAASSEELAATSQEIEKAVRSIAEKSQEGAIHASEIEDRAENTKTNVQIAQKNAVEIFLSTKTDLEKALEASKIVNKINTLSDAIMEITAQTSLLSLNASIEASRAGEAGRGFSVVANEIKNLSEESKVTVIEIQNVTKEVIQSVKDLSNSANSLLAFMSTDVNNDYETMLNVADKYSEDAKFVNILVTEFSSTSEELLASIEEILKTIDGVAVAASEGAGGTVDIANKVSDINTKSSEITNRLTNLKVSSSELKTGVSMFKI